MAKAVKAPPADFALLSEEDRERIRNEARLVVAEERRKEAEKAYLEEALSEERRDKGIEEPLITGTLDLAPEADRILIDGRPFLHGMSYTLPRSVWQTLMECQSRGWNHHYETREGKSKLAQGPSFSNRSPTLSPHGVVNTSNLMRA